MPKPRQISSHLFYGFCAIVLIFICPIPSARAPVWDVTVMDQAGNPLPNVLVRESYQNYSAETIGHEEDRYTDAQGDVHFAAKRIYAPFRIRLAVTAFSVLGGAHASFGPHSYVTAFSGANTGDDARGGHLYAWEGSPTHETSRLVLGSSVPTQPQIPANRAR